MTFIDSSNLANGLQQTGTADIIIGPLTKEAVEKGSWLDRLLH